MRNQTQHSTLEETLVEDLEKLLCMEKAFLMTMPMMAQSANNGEVQREFERLTGETREQIARLQLLISPALPSVQAHIEDEPKEYNAAQPALKDCMLIADVRKKQHAKIALYSTVCLWANQLGLQKMEDTLKQNLKEEEADSERLLQLAHQVGCPVS